LARPAPAASRAVAVLSLMTTHPAQVFTLSDLAERLGVNYASMHAVMSVLERAGFVSRHPSHKTYELGPAAIALGHAALDRNPYIDVARDEMRRLAGDLDLELLLVARVGDEMVAVAKAGRTMGSWVNMRVGQRISLKPPLGLAFVAWDADEELERWLAKAGPDATPEELSHYRRVVAAVRRQGYSVGLEGHERERLGGLLSVSEGEASVSGTSTSVQSAIEDLGHATYHVEKFEEGRAYDVAVLNAPIFDALGRPMLLMSMAGYRRQLMTEEVRAYGERLRVSGQRVTSVVRGHAPR